MTKQGSKDMQKIIERALPNLIEQIVNEIRPLLAEVLIDQYGNYFCQKLFPKLNSEQFGMLIDTLS